MLGPRALLKLAAIGAATAVGLPLQALALQLGARASHRLPVVYHRAICRILGIRLIHDGEPPQDRMPVLIVANHVSWLDISVIGAVRPLAFVSKSEVRDWPGFGLLARLQRTVFVDRSRRAATATVASAMGRRLGAGETIVLFAEGTTGDGSRILPFKSSLLGAVREALGADSTGDLLVQPLAVVYRGRHGLPEGRHGRAELAWAGDMELAPHLTEVLDGGPIDVHLVWGAPIRATAESCRKEITRAAESAVRKGFQAAIRR